MQTILSLAMLGLLQALASSPSQKAPAPVAGDAGAWTLFRDGEGAPSCQLTLESRAVIGGAALKVSSQCQQVTAHADELYAWYRNASGQLVMADPTRHAVLVFHALPNGVWATEGSDAERLLLQRRRP